MVEIFQLERKILVLFWRKIVVLNAAMSKKKNPTMYNFHSCLPSLSIRRHEPVVSLI
jgi:hypothetical protein